YSAGDTSASPGTVTVGSGATFTTNDSLTLESDINGTSRVAQNTSGSTYLTGKVSIERYVQTGYRAWRLFSGQMISSAQTINAAWQEGQTNTSTSGAGQFNATPGYGTEITNLIPTPASTGYDQAATNNSSLLYLNSG